MFTGIVEEIGTVVEALSVGGGIRLTVEAPKTVAELKTSDSVAINGVCQTVVERGDKRFTVVAVEETLSKTTMRNLKASSRVNLELPLRLGDRLGGHIVAGHVDCVGGVESIEQRDTSWLFGISVPSRFERYVIPVGSIAVDGVSLTVASLATNLVVVSIIPHTMENSIFSSYTAGTKVNLEFDMIGKYLERLISSAGSKSSADTISIEQMKLWGYKE